MKPTRATVLAGLVLVAGAAPVTAYAVAGGSNDAGSSHSSVGHQKVHDQAAKPDHATGQDRADEASAPGQAHAEAMKAWAHCVADAASGPKTGERTGPPKDACGDKPVGPGRAKHADDDAKPGKSGEPHGKSGDSHGRGQGHRH
jgi:hypothetical protein